MLLVFSVYSHSYLLIKHKGDVLIGFSLNGTDNKQTSQSGDIPYRL